jgi:transposase
MTEWLKPNDEVFIYQELLQNLDLSKFYEHYRKDGEGGKFIDPVHLLGVLFYCSSNGIYSSRKIEEECIVNVRCRYLAGNMPIDHSTIARFRQKNLDGIKDLFTQFLIILHEAKMIDPRLLALDGTKIKANASLSKNKTYKRLKQVAREFVENGQAADDAEKQSGIQETLRESATRKEIEERIRRAKEIVEERHRAEVDLYDKKMKQREIEEKEAGKPKTGRKPKPPTSEPDPSEKANTTDPNSRVVKTRVGYEQGYNAQSISTQNGFVVANWVRSQENDLHQLIPALDMIHDLAERFGIDPAEITLLADAGYFSYENMMTELSSEVNLMISPSKELKLKSIPEGNGYAHEVQRICWGQGTGLLSCCAASIGAWANEYLKQNGEWPTKEMIAKIIMGSRVATEGGRKLYGMRKYMIESIFGIIKENRGFRAFHLRGLDGVNGEWALVNMCHNIKLGIKKGIGSFLKQRSLENARAIAGF